MSKRNLEIVLDYDDTLVATSEQALEKANSSLGTNFEFEDWVTYTWLFDEVSKITNWAGPDVFEFLFGSDVIQQVQMFLGIKDQLALLQEVGVNANIATSRPPEQAELTREIIARDLAGIVRPEDVHIREDETMSGEELKFQVVENIKPVAYLDDDPKTVLLFLGSLPNGMSADAIRLMSQPWNEDISMLNGRRHQTFPDFVGWLSLKHNLGLR